MIDAFLAAADVFQPSELPSHRVAWLRKLAEFHSFREKYAEEATCRFMIHQCLSTSAALNDSLWNSVPFWPWASDASDGVHLNGDGPTGSSTECCDSEHDLEGINAPTDYNLGDNGGKSLDKNHSFRRIFYRVANSVRMRTGEIHYADNISP